MSKRCCAKMCFNSQITNKTVTYFAFPKYAQFASEWAIAAGREDLLEKKLNSIIKYYLCSEHFTNDSFIDPPHNTRLKKTSHPVNIPIPTIFLCNIDKYIPCRKQSTNDEEEKQTDESDDITFVLTHPSESKSRSNHHLNYQEIPIGSSLLKNNSNKNDSSERSSSPHIDNIVVNIENVDYLTDDHTFDNIDTSCTFYITPHELGLIDEGHKTNIFDTAEDTDGNDNNVDSTTSIYVCRLCAMVFINDDSLLRIADEPGLCDKLDRLLPNNIKINDELPQQVCTECFKKINSCIEIIDNFLLTQGELKTLYGVN